MREDLLRSYPLNGYDLLTIENTLVPHLEFQVGWTYDNFYSIACPVVFSILELQDVLPWALHRFKTVEA